VNNKVFAEQNNFTEARTSTHQNYPLKNNYCPKPNKIFLKKGKRIASK